MNKINNRKGIIRVLDVVKNKKKSIDGSEIYSSSISIGFLFSKTSLVDRSSKEIMRQKAESNSK
jgi:hypothetical protein